LEVTGLEDSPALVCTEDDLVPFCRRWPELEGGRQDDLRSKWLGGWSTGHWP
jgi:hypothetical protein